MKIHYFLLLASSLLLIPACGCKKQTKAEPKRMEAMEDVGQEPVDIKEIGLDDDSVTLLNIEEELPAPSGEEPMMYESVSAEETDFGSPEVIEIESMEESETLDPVTV